MTTMTLVNPKHYVTGAVSTFIIVLTGSASYTLTSVIPPAHEVIAINAVQEFTSGTDADRPIGDTAWTSNFSFLADVPNKKISVVSGTVIQSGTFSLRAFVTAKKAGGVSVYP